MRVRLLKEVSILLIIVTLFYVIQLGSRSLNNPDEGRYSSVAYDMMESGNYVTPKVMGAPFFDKPPMYYWLQISTFKLFGVNTWSIRLWPTLVTIWGIVFTYLTARIIFNKKVALLSAVVLATSPLYYFASRYANMDLEVAVFISSTLFSFLLGVISYPKSSSKWWYLLAYAFASIAFLTKGLIALVFPIVIIGFWILFFKKWKIILQMQLIPGLLIVILIISPWLYLVAKQNPGFLHYFFVYQQFERFLSTANLNLNNQMPFWFYLAITLGGLASWSILLLSSFKTILKDIKAKVPKFEYLVFLIIWILFILLFFSIPKAKLVGYILPIFPAVSILIGYTAAKAWHSKNLGIKLAASLQFILLFALIVVQFFLVNYKNIWLGTNNYYPYFFIPFILLLVPLIWFMIKCYAFSYFYCYTAVVAIIFLLILNASSVYLYTKPPSTKPLYKVLKNYLNSNSKVVVFNSYLPDLTLYVQKAVYFVDDWETVAKEPLVDSDVSRIAKGCYNNSQKQCPLLLSYAELRKLWLNKDNNVYVVVKITNLTTFKNLISNNYYILKETPALVLISNKIS